VQRAHEILRAMVPAEAQLDASALGLELLGVTASLFRCVLALLIVLSARLVESSS